MGIDFLVLLVATIVGLYSAVNIGSNDLANAMGTSVGSGAITVRQAVIISVVANIFGAVIAGGYVTSTISKGLISPSLFLEKPDHLMLGMFSALLASGIWVNISSYYGLPVSTTHAIVGAVVGFGMISVGAGSIAWGKVIKVVISWVVSPISGAVIAGAMFYFTERMIFGTKDPGKSIERYSPFLIFLVFVVLFLSIIFKGMKNLHLEISFLNALLLSLPMAGISGILGKALIRWRMKRHSSLTSSYQLAQQFFAYLQIMTACYVAFAHGANDVANAVGPLATIFSVVKTKSVALKVEVPFWMLFVGGMAIGGGLLFFGQKVMETIGKNITHITPTRGFCAEFGAASTILVCSRLGLPVSTTHVLVGSVIGVGVMRGMGALDLRIIKNIAVSWVVTLPFTIIVSMLLYKLLIFLLL